MPPVCRILHVPFLGLKQEILTSIISTKPSNPAISGSPIFLRTSTQEILICLVKNL